MEFSNKQGAVPVGPNQFYYSQWGKAQMQNDLTLTTLADPYALNIQKQKYMLDNYRQINDGASLPNHRVMLDMSMMRKQQAMLENDRKTNPYKYERFVPPQAAMIPELMLKNQLEPSRFYSNKKVSPSTAASDVQWSQFQQSNPNAPTGDSPMVDGMTPFMVPMYKYYDDEVEQNETTGGYGQYMASQGAMKFKDYRQQLYNSKMFTSLI